MSSGLLRCWRQAHPVAQAGLLMGMYCQHVILCSSVGVHQVQPLQWCIEAFSSARPLFCFPMFKQGLSAWSGSWGNSTRLSSLRRISSLFILPLLWHYIHFCLTCSDLVSFQAGTMKYKFHQLWRTNYEVVYLMHKDWNLCFTISWLLFYYYYYY